ncbi:MAG: alcohol dehydrogenase catalytic domain-containing protein [Lachnospiraceae bacterium]|nr:alcohol dehydrogenase catalytic domain-containing protein [Lachnospiraceae bacterium]
MKKILFTKPMKAEVAGGYKIPVCEKDEVVLKVLRIGVCGTDIQVYAGKNRYTHFPITPFHEGLATVFAVGAKVENVCVGDSVVIRPIISCGKCYACTHGHENACEEFNCLGVQSDGLGAEYVVINKKYVYRLPKFCSKDALILTEPFAVGVHAARRGQIENKKVLVIGAGTIGNFTAQACQLQGAEKVCICDISEAKVDTARKSGIELCINSTNKTLTQVYENAFGSFPDVIIDCAASKAVFSQIISSAGKTTTVVIVGNYSQTLEVDIAAIQRNELNVLGNITYTEEDFLCALNLMLEGKVYTDGFITKRFALNQVNEMMDYAFENRGINMKTIMDFEEG